MNVFDNCDLVQSPLQQNSDGDDQGDACNDEADNDGIVNVSDNCSADANGDQRDTDSDQFGDACDNDTDEDVDGGGRVGFSEAIDVFVFLSSL